MRIFQTCPKVGLFLGGLATTAILISPILAMEARLADAALVSELIQLHCVQCHGGEETNAGIEFTGFQDELDVWQMRETWTKVLRVLREGAMPPEYGPTLADSDRTQLIRWVAHTLDNVDIERIPRDPGFVPPRRLTRKEYSYTVQDLFGISADPGQVFPEDQTIDDGFDNDASTLTVGPLWFEKALEAAEVTVRAVWASPDALDRLLTTRPSPPLVKDSALYIPTAEVSQRCDLGDGDFTVLAQIRGTSGGIFLKAPRGQEFGRGSQEFVVDDDALVFRIRLGRALRAEGVEIDDGKSHWVGLTVHDGRAALFLDGRLLASRASFFRPDFREFPLKIGRASRRRDRDSDRRGLELVEFRFYSNGLSDETISAVTTDTAETRLPEPVLRWVPGMESPQPKGFVTTEVAGRAVLNRFLSKAFRRAPTEDELSRYFGLFRQGADSGLPFEIAMQEPVATTLMSPSFLFRAETAADTDEPYEVSSIDMASRLSYFLWSSMPDEELQLAGENGKLTDPQELLRHTDRMLADEKAQRFFERFVLQWLRTEGLGDTIRPDTDRFPEISDSLLASMREESVLLFGTAVRKNRSLLRLLDDEITFMNGELAAHYGHAEVSGSHWREVRLHDATRGGMLTQAAVLTVSSSPRRTSPVFRGKWILEVLLGEPPPPPPPNVPELPVEVETSGASLRELLEIHRSQEVCAGCHRRIDPYGLTLEQYDAIGRLRTDQRDTTATLFSGEHLNGAGELKRYLVEQKGSAFVRHITKKMLAYALGRELTFPDERPVHRILERLESDGYGAKSLIREIILSDPFRNRKNS